MFHAMSKKTVRFCFQKPRKGNIKTVPEQSDGLNENFNQTYVDNLINSMWNRSELIIKLGVLNIVLV